MTPAEKSGLCDGLLGQECQSPTQWPDCEEYLVRYLQGKDYRIKNEITLTYERQKS